MEELKRKEVEEELKIKEETKKHEDLKGDEESKVEIEEEIENKSNTENENQSKSAFLQCGTIPPPMHIAFDWSWHVPSSPLAFP